MVIRVEFSYYEQKICYYSEYQKLKFTEYNGYIIEEYYLQLNIIFTILEISFQNLPLLQRCWFNWKLRYPSDFNYTY